MGTIEQEIRSVINDTIKGEYIGKLKVLHDNDEWALLLYLDTEASPLILCCQGTRDTFIEFVRSEIKTRKLQKVGFYKAERSPYEYEIEDYGQN